MIFLKYTYILVVYLSSTDYTVQTSVGGSHSRLPPHGVFGTFPYSEFRMEGGDTLSAKTRSLISVK